MPKVFIKNADGSVGKQVDVSNAQAAEAIRNGTAYSDDRETYYGTDVDGKQISLNAKEFGDYLGDESTKLRDAGDARAFADQERIEAAGKDSSVKAYNIGKNAIDMMTLGLGTGAASRGADAIDALIHKDKNLDGSLVNPDETWRDRYNRNKQAGAEFNTEVDKAREGSYDALIGGGLGMAATLGLSGAGALATRGLGGAAAKGLGVSALESIGAKGAAESLGKFGATTGGKLALGAAHGAGVGAGFGAGGYVGNEVLLHNKDLSAEKLMGAAGHGALLGGAFGLGLSGLGVAAGGASRGIGRLARGTGAKAWEGMESTLTKFRKYMKEKGGLAAAEGEALGEKSAGAAAEGEALAGKSIDELADYFAKGDPAKAKALKVLGEHGDGFTRHAAKEVDAAGKSFLDNLTSYLEAEDGVSGMMKGSAKVRNIGKVVKGGNVAAQLDNLTATIEKVGADFKAAKAAGKGHFGKRASIDKIIAETEAYAERARKLSAQGGENAAAEAFQMQDDLKRMISGHRGRKAASMASADGAAVDLIEKNYETIRQGLESEEMWGQAAALQKEINAPWTRDINMSRDVFDKHFTTKSGKALESNPWRTGRMGDSAKVKSFFQNGVEGLAGTNARDGLRSTIANKRQWLSSLKKNAELTADELTAVGEQEARLSSMEEAFDKSVERAKVIGDAQDLIIEETSKKGLIDLMPGLSNLAKFTEQAGNMQRLGNYRGAIGKFDESIGKALKALAGAGEGSGALGKALAGAKKLDAMADKVARGAGRAAMTTGEQVNKALLRKLTTTEFDKISDGLQSPRPEQADEVADLNKAAPGLGDAYATQVNGARAYLLGHMPKRPTDILGKSTAPLSIAEKRDFLKRLGAVSDPASVLEKVRKGTVSPAEIDALKQVYPKVFAEMQADAVAMVSKRGKSMGYQEKMRLGTLLGIPFDRTMSPEFIGKIQGQYQANAQAREQAKAAPLPKATTKNYGRKLLPKSERIGVELWQAFSI